MSTSKIPERRCPICQEPAAPRTTNKHFPFCSNRCRLIDLGQWITESYRVPMVAEEDEDGTPAIPEELRN